jgi:4-hydroxy-tetrahydrodipicolinate reductase
MNIAICGAAGRMGCAITRLFPTENDLKLVAAMECHDHPAIGRDAGELAGAGEMGVQIRVGLEMEPDVLIDFSLPQATRSVVHLCRERRIPMVIGTTGLSDDDRAELNRTAEVVPCVYSPNMSAGVNLLFELAPKVAAMLGEAYDVEIVEMHHRHKKDAPSGTALRLGERIAEGRGTTLDADGVFGREGPVGERPSGQIGIHAVRGGDVFGDHFVVFAGPGERVELVHKASSREALARGALRAARYVLGRAPGLYSMRDVLGL